MKDLILMVDTETANTHQEDRKHMMDDVLVYDCGVAVVDRQGVIYYELSMVNKDIFVNEFELMQSAYYARKLPQYYDDLKSGKRLMCSTYEMKKIIAAIIERYNIKHVCAHNARFDVRALNNTQRWTTKSKYRYFFPYGVEIWDTMRMATDTICKQPTYKKWCQKNGYVTKNGQVRKTAEILYRYITKNNDFVECHTGLEDVKIETAILAYCFRQKKKMRKILYESH